MITLGTQILSDSTFLMYLPRPRALIIALLVAFSLLIRASIELAERFTRNRDLAVPTVHLWLIPLGCLFSAYGLMMILLAGVHSWIGRGFWSDVIHLNAKMTTVLFTTTFISFKIYILVGFLGAIWEYLRFFIAVFEAGDSLKEKAAVEESLRQRASRFNRRCFFGMGTLCLVLGCGLVFLKPETVLYYRGEIQVRSGVHPEAALEAFQHLLRKYPGYRYRDTVEYRAAWVLDRRLKDYPAAIQAYQTFLTTHGFTNVWAPDILANLIAIYLDHRKDANEALKWIAVFEEKYPDSVSLPLIAFSKIRALLQEQRHSEARQAVEAARRQFNDRTLILYDSEDDFMTTLPFDAALGTLNL